MNDNPIEASSSASKCDAVESEASVESKSLKDNDMICSICLALVSHEDASKACPNSDKHDFHKKCLSEYIFQNWSLTFDRWIDEKVGSNPTPKLHCPYCKCPLNIESIDRDIAKLCDPHQLSIALDAWMEMGGNRYKLFSIKLKCKGDCEIQTDLDGNILEINWDGKGLNGNLSSKLGKLPRLEKL